MANESDRIRLEFHVDPQFIHRPLAAQALGADEGASLWRIADQITAAVVDRQLPDLRLLGIEGELSAIERKIVTIRSGFYFRRTGEGDGERIRFRDRIKIDQGSNLTVEGEFDPRRFETNSAAGNLSKRANVFIVGIATDVQEENFRVIVRPLLIGIPYFTHANERRRSFSSARPEIYCPDVDQFRLDSNDLRVRVPDPDLRRLFAIPEQRVKEAFGEILGLSTVPADWGGEHSDLVANVSIRGISARAAFAFKGPGGRTKPWTLYPANMGQRGDQSVRLFAEPADVMIVQHCSIIAESVRHIMDALATMHRKQYILIDGDNTVRILRKADLLR